VGGGPGHKVGELLRADVEHGDPVPGRCWGGLYPTLAGDAIRATSGPAILIVLLIVLVLALLQPRRSRGVEKDYDED